MALKLYLDSHIAKQVAVQLRAKGVDVVRCEEVEMAAARDEAHLEYATREGRAMVSHDSDFAALHASWLWQGKEHSGIFWVTRFLQGQAAISYLVTVLYDYHQMIELKAGTIEHDIYNQLIHL